jgi:endoglucanase
MPGMLVGGPDSNLDDSYAQATLSGKPAAACYVDDEQSYSCNEITIYWNSPLVYLLTGIGG